MLWARVTAMRFLFEKTVRTDVLKENSWEPPRPDDGKGYRKPISRFPPECFLPRPPPVTVSEYRIPEYEI